MKPKKITLIIKQIDGEDYIIKKIHRGGNSNKIYGRVYVPEKWIGKDVYIVLVNKNGRKIK